METVYTLKLAINDNNSSYYGIQPPVPGEVLNEFVALTRENNPDLYFGSRNWSTTYSEISATVSQGDDPATPLGEDRTVAIGTKLVDFLNENGYPTAADSEVLHNVNVLYS